MPSQDPRYPIGKFAPKERITPEERTTLIHQIAHLPEELIQAVAGLTEDQLNTPYREGGWTVRQVVHHVADSHMNAFIRMRLAVTEESPTVKPYNEKKWAELFDTRTAPVDLSITLIEALHTRWVMMMESFSADDFSRGVQHPENGPMNVDRLLQLYAWHGRHHCAHVTELRRLRGW
jgi:uncharacterized damage-inducible protein DinB